MPSLKMWRSITVSYTHLSDVLTGTTGVIMPDAIDTSDATYKAWKDEESINIYTYLNYAISKNWIDTSLLRCV